MCPEYSAPACCPCADLLLQLDFGLYASKLERKSGVSAPTAHATPQYEYHHHTGSNGSNQPTPSTLRAFMVCNRKPAGGLYTRLRVKRPPPLDAFRRNGGGQAG